MCCSILLFPPEADSIIQNQIIRSLFTFIQNCIEFAGTSDLALELFQYSREARSLIEPPAIQQSPFVFSFTESVVVKDISGFISADGKK